MFYKKKVRFSYYEKIKDIKNELCDTLFLPIEVDTEFQQMHYPFQNEKDRIKATISIQMKPILGEPSFFLHPDMKKYLKNSSFTYINEEFCVFDLIIKHGYSVVKHQYKPLRYGKLFIELYGFFLVSDIARLFSGEWLNFIKERITSNNKKQGIIKHDKRLSCFNRSNISICDPFINTEKYISIEGKPFLIYIGIVDNCALQGNISYNDLCNNTKIYLRNKNQISNEEKKYMLDVIKKTPHKFVEYAKDDLFNYEALNGHTDLVDELYNLLDLNSYNTFPKPTIGATVQNLLEAALMKYFNIPNTKTLASYVQNASHKILIENLSSTQAYLAKTNGGRCYNNRPLEPSLTGVMVDIDIKSCYGQGLKLQEYPIGNPIILEYNIRSEKNDYLSLRSFLTTYGNELEEGLWYSRISTKEELSFDQDFFISWYPPRNLNEIIETDSEKQENEDISTLLEGDYTKIYSRQIHLAPFQSDGIEWIKNCLTKQERDEFLSKTFVIAAAFYPKSCKCTDMQDFNRKRKNHSGMNTCSALINEDKTMIKRISMENYHWYSENIGDIIITKLLEKRAEYSKNNLDQRPMNELIKLTINAVYGVIVSPYFHIGNTIVGNNITSRARAMAWYMEKALHATQTITDGCCFDMNKVVKSRYALTNIKYTRIKKIGPQKDLILASLLESKISINELKILNNEDIANRIIKHIKKCFPKVKVINKYEIEVKQIFTGLSTHGASNYQMRIGQDIIKTKMRSYRNIEYSNIDTDKKILLNKTKCVENWLDSIYKNPSKVRREEPFVEEEIIKTNRYRRNIERMNANNQFVGDIEYKVRLLNECTLSMFLFRTHEQYLSWHSEYHQLKNCYRQSYESMYTDEEKNLDYKKMINDIQSKIDNGENRYFKKRKKNLVDHPMREKFEEIQVYINKNISEDKTIIGAIPYSVI